MERATDNKIILVKRKTRLEELIYRYNTVEQAKFYIEHMGSDFSDYTKEDEQYKKVISQAINDLEDMGRVQILDREYLPNFIFSPNDIVVAIGQDGLVANTLKYLTNQQLIGINPEPQRWDGILLPFTVSDLRLVITDVFNSKRQIKEVTMGKVSLNDGQTLYSVNDIFLGQKTHMSARYEISFSNLTEQQCSSGIIVSTGLGSSGWLKSVLTGAMSIANSISSNMMKTEIGQIPWDTDALYFSVREPFPSNRTSTNIIFGKVNKTKPLKIVSQMPENGVIFSDGIESDFLHFNTGVEATITVAEKKGHLVV